MSIYKRFDHPHGSRYRRDNKLFSGKNIPEAIKIQLDIMPAGTEIDENFEPPKEERNCIFCGMDAKIPTTINGQTIFRCEQHYYDTNIGQVVTQLRNKQLA